MREKKPRVAKLAPDILLALDIQRVGMTSEVDAPANPANFTADRAEAQLTNVEKDARLADLASEINFERTW
jgi:hypothetical protein